MKGADYLIDRLLYRDGLILVIDKPAGLPVHAGTGGGENLEQYFDVLQFGLPNPPSLAHRLDRDTSGCLILGRHRKALQKLGKLFTVGAINKTYWAIVQGAPPASEGRIDLPLIKQSSDKRRWQMKIAGEGEGLPTVTDYKLMGQANGLSWLELYPRTGRTHQLRVHCEAIGCSILGDKIYGEGSVSSLLHLHARAIEIPLYPKKEPVVAIAPAPAHMEAIIKMLN